MDSFKNIPEEIKENIINLLSGKITTQEANMLLSWLKQDEANKKFFDEMADIWHTSSSLKKENEFDTNKAWNELNGLIQTNQEVKRGAINRWLKPFSAVAAVLIIAVLTGLLLNQYSKNRSNSEQFIEVIAPLGSRTIAILPDGTKLWLNSGSKISFSNTFGKTTRDLKLDGEAFFAVAKNKALPFVVHTSEINVTALGTAFNVKAYADDNIIETTLEEGSVKIESVSGLNMVNKPLILKPKEKAVYNKVISQKEKQNIDAKEVLSTTTDKTVVVNTEIIKVDSVADTKLYTSWKDNRWLFRHETLESLARKLERRYDVTIEFKDDELKTYKFSGSLYDESIEQVFEAIKLIAPIDYKVNHKHIEIYTNRVLQKKLENLMK